jgi:hypothetical protein
VSEGSVHQQAEKGSDVAVITDGFMREMRARAQGYPLVILRRAARYDDLETRAIIWDHRSRSHSLRTKNVLATVCPVADETEWSGIGIFDETPEETARIMGGDPAVQAGVLSYEDHPVRGYPGDSLQPGQGGGR